MEFLGIPKVYRIYDVDNKLIIPTDKLWKWKTIGKRDEEKEDKKDVILKIGKKQRIDSEK